MSSTKEKTAANTTLPRRVVLPAASRPSITIRASSIRRPKISATTKGRWLSHRRRLPPSCQRRQAKPACTHAHNSSHHRCQAVPAALRHACNMLQARDMSRSNKQPQASFFPPPSPNAPTAKFRKQQAHGKFVSVSLLRVAGCPGTSRCCR